MTPEELAISIAAAVSAAVSVGELADTPDFDARQVVVERPRSKDHGDYATNVAMRLAKAAGVPPREVATILASHLRQSTGIQGVDVAGPGFLNITLETAAQGELARSIVAAGQTFGTINTLAGLRINLEFISANPTGPLHLGHTRWAAVGDAIGRVLEAAGAEVVREFYVNDFGAQMEHFGVSLRDVANGRPVPKDGYHGAYIVELAAFISQEHPEFLGLSDDEQLAAFRDVGYQMQLEEQKRVLELFRTQFDVWTSEKGLHQSGAVELGVEKLRKQGHVFDDGGAIWLRTTDFGDDKDRVLIKSDGITSYFAADCAYYLDKRARGFDVNIYLLGADHHGYVGRLKAIVACAGDDPDHNIDVLIGQMVKIVKDEEEVRLSKRAGTIVTLEELVGEVGVDAARYALCRYPVDSPLTLDLGILVKQTNDNPVYYVQYAHARISSLLRAAGELSITIDPSAFLPELLEHDREGDLLGSLGEFPRVVASAAELREPHRVARYLEELANAYHKFYDSCRVLPRGDEEVTDVMRARLMLCAATRQVLANGLDLLGVSAPEQM